MEFCSNIASANALRTEGAVGHGMARDKLDEYMGKVKASFHKDFDDKLPDHLVISSGAAHWIDPAKIANPSRIGLLLDLPTKSFDISLQEIPGNSATDMQRHAHEAVHFVLDGAGYSEIGPRACQWGKGDFIYTPVWAWHRHYNTGSTPASLLIIENSILLETLGLHQRQSAGLIDYETLQQGCRPL